MVSRGKLGERLYTSQNKYNWPTNLMTSYDSLQDPHLRKYYQRTDMQKMLRKNDMSTAENEVRCSMTEFKLHQRYLIQCKVTSERRLAEIHKARMMAFLKDKERGLVGQEMILTDMRELILGEEVETMRNVMKCEAARERKYCKRPRNSEEEEKKRELYLMSWKVEEREVLRKLERDVRQEFNKEKLRRETQERRERQKMALEEGKKARYQMQMMEKIKLAEAAANRERAQSRLRRGVKIEWPVLWSNQKSDDS